MSYAADGLVGGHLPVVRFVLPISPTSPFLPKNASFAARYWDMVAAAVPDMNGTREQSVWFR